MKDQIIYPDYLGYARMVGLEAEALEDEFLGIKLKGAGKKLTTGLGKVTGKIITAPVRNAANFGRGLFEGTGAKKAVEKHQAKVAAKKDAAAEEAAAATQPTRAEIKTTAPAESDQSAVAEADVNNETNANSASGADPGANEQSIGGSGMIIWLGGGLLVVIALALVYRQRQMAARLAMAAR